MWGTRLLRCARNDSAVIASAARKQSRNRRDTQGKAAPMTTPTQPMRKTLTVNGLALHYLEWGEAEAPPIVCVHGYTGSADAFNALARQLKDRYRILALDVRGHGESAWSPTGAYSYADQAGDLAECAGRLGLDQVVLIGTSMR